MQIQETLTLLQIIFFPGSIILASLAYFNVRRQLTHSKKVAKVQFLYDLQKNWLLNHKNFSKEFFGDGIFSTLNNDNGNEQTPKNKKEKEKTDKHFEVREYLNFFELIAIAIRNKAIDFDQTDDLFGHRFCRLYNNKWVQENIIHYHEYNDGYKMLSEVGEEWIKHRRKKGRTVYL